MQLTKSSILFLACLLLINVSPNRTHANKSMTFLNRVLKTRGIELDKNIQRMSKGTLLVVDNPAYFAIYEKLEAHIRGMDKYIHNNGDMYNYYQFEESLLSSITASLQRIRELSLGLSNGLMGDFERDIIKGEMRQHYDQILYDLRTAQFNKKYLFKEILDHPDVKKRFDDPRFYQVGKIDEMLQFFIYRRVILGAQMNRIKHQINAIEIEKENTAAFQSQGDTDYAREMSDFKKNQLLLMVNLMMLGQ